MVDAAALYHALKLGYRKDRTWGPKAEDWERPKTEPSAQ